MAKNLFLLPGEEVAFQLEGDVYGGGANPVSQAIARFIGFFQRLLGTKLKATLVVTNKRVIQYRERITCWCIPTATDFKVILPQSIQEVGYRQVTTCGCFPYFTLYYKSIVEAINFPIKGGSQETLADYVAKFYSAIKA